MIPAPFSALYRRDQQTCQITIDGTVYTIAPRSVDLLDALSLADPLAIVPGLVGRDAGRLMWTARQRGSRITIPFLRRVGADTTAILLGIPWQAGWQLASLLSAHWLTLCAQLHRVGIDPVTAPVHRTLATVYGIITAHLSPEDAIKIDDQLWAWPDHLDLGTHTPATESRYVRTVSGGRKLKRMAKVLKPPPAAG